MASSKKAKGAKGKKNTREKKTLAPVEKKKIETSSKKRNDEKKSSNNTVREPDVLIVPSSSTESRDEGDRGKRGYETPSKDRGKGRVAENIGKKQEVDEEEEKEDTSICRFPMKKMRRMMKSQFSDSLVAGDAVFLVNKATENFLEQFSAEAYACCIKDRKKTVSHQHLASVASKQKRYDFLSDFLLEDLPLLKKPKNNSSGIVSETEELIVPSSSIESQEEQEKEQEQKKRSQASPRNQCNKSMKCKTSEKEDNEEEKVDATVYKFPMERIRRIMKSHDSDSTVSGETVFLVNRATEKFLERFCEDAYSCCVEDRKKSLHYQHLASVVSKKRRYDFLSDFVPEKVKAEDALVERKTAETGQDRN